MEREERFGRGGRPARVALGAMALALALALPTGAAVPEGERALREGRYAEAEAEFRKAPPADRAAAWLGLAQVFRETGRYEEALKTLAQAAAVPATKAPALCLAGEIHRETGRLPEAIRSLQAAMAAAGNARSTLLRARLYLAVALHETGRKAEAEKLFDRFFQEYNAGKIEEKADQLTYTAIAARYLQAWQDASDTFQSAVEKDPRFIQANLEWGDLFLLKYNATEAARCFRAALRVNPNHPAARVGMARAILEQNYDVRAATRLADEALKVHPRFVPALRLKARLALDDERFAPAEALLRRALDINPADLESMALLAAGRYLQEDLAGYESLRQRALKQNPAFSDFYVLVSELVERHHRYEDAVRLNRQAVQLDPKNAAALASLGMNLLRLGMDREPEALEILDKAFQLDGYNVRTYNTLQLFEQVIAKEYETVPDGIFLFRLNRKERPLLIRYVPRLMQEAWDRYVRKYGFTPKHPIAVELFTERQHYGARTIGLPELGAQGTCFGQLITAMSPASAEASWEEVLWHELAHVFHLQLSRNRVSRWFTEGLAEYETNLARPYWKREYGREIYLSLKRGDLWSIGELSAAFTRPDRPNGVVIAYHLSSLVIHYLAETYGFPKLVEALKLYGAGKRDAEVLTAITGKSIRELDAGLHAYLLRRLSHYEKGFLFDPQRYADLKAIRAEAEAKPNDPAAQAKYAAALLAAAEEPGNPELMAQARRAVAMDPGSTLARFVLAEALLGARDYRAARAEYETLLKAGTDGYPIRFALARIAVAEGDGEAVIRHLDQARTFDPDRVEPYVLLMSLYEAAGRRDELQKVTEAYLDLQEHDHDAARLLIDRYAADKRWEDVARVGPRVIGITPMEAYVHQQYGTALAILGRPKEAVPELEAALLAGLRKPGPTRALLARQYLALGEIDRAKAAARQALEEDPGNPDAEAVLKN